jgi:hypothetical protein
MAPVDEVIVLTREQAYEPSEVIGVYSSYEEMVKGLARENTRMRDEYGLPGYDDPVKRTWTGPGGRELHCWEMYTARENALYGDLLLAQVFPLNCELQ